jgi:hypothetical protein
MLRGHSTFKQLKAQYENRIEYHKKGNDKNISPEDLARVKSEIKVWAQKQRRKQRMILAVSMLLFVSSFSIIYVIGQELMRKSQGNRIALEQTQKAKKVKFYLDDAQFMLTQEKYYNANFQYRKAIEVKPTHTIANAGVVFSLTQLCIKENRRCNEIEMVYSDCFDHAADKELFVNELFKLSLNSDAKTKLLLQNLVQSVDEKNF